MINIDLSQAKIGDKFRTRGGLVLTYYKEYENHGIHILKKESGMAILFLENGSYMAGGDMHLLDLIEQVFDDEKDTTDREIVEAMNQAIKDIPEKAAAREKELQRRQEVVELARKMLFDDNTYQFYTQFYVRAMQNEGAEQVMTYLQYIIDYAEDCVNKFNQYLKEGKL